MKAFNIDDAINMVDVQVNVTCCRQKVIHIYDSKDDSQYPLSVVAVDNNSRPYFFRVGYDGKMDGGELMLFANDNLTHNPKGESQ